MTQTKLSHRQALLLTLLDHLHASKRLRQSNVGGSLALSLHLGREHRPPNDLDLFAPPGTVIGLGPLEGRFRADTTILSVDGLFGYPHVLLVEAEVAWIGYRSRVRLDIDARGLHTDGLPHPALPHGSTLFPVRRLLENKMDLILRRHRRWGLMGLTVENFFDLALLARLDRAAGPASPRARVAPQIPRVLDDVRFDLENPPPPWDNGWRKLSPSSMGLPENLVDAIDSLIVDLTLPS